MTEYISKVHILYSHLLLKINSMALESRKGGKQNKKNNRNSVGSARESSWARNLIDELQVQGITKNSPAEVIAWALLHPRKSLNIMRGVSINGQSGTIYSAGSSIHDKESTTIS